MSPAGRREGELESGRHEGTPPSSPAVAAPAAPPMLALGRIRRTGAAILIVLAALVAAAPHWSARLQEAWFDAYQRLRPREITSMPAVVVEIDPKSLAALGLWPWPRTLLAELVGRVHQLGPAAIGVDILMPEPDPWSPERLLARAGKTHPSLAPVVAGLAPQIAAAPSNDAVLAQALAAAPTVLAVAGMPQPTGMPLRTAPVLVSGATGPVAPGIAHFAGALTSIDELNRAASGWGLISANPAEGVLRRVPLVARIDGTLIPAMAVELFRVAAGAPALRMTVDGPAVRGVAIEQGFVGTEADGAVRLYYSPRTAARLVSAIDVLTGNVDPERLRRKLALIAVTGLGLGEYHYTPVGERMPGGEIHAQLLENLYDQTLLRRPAHAALIEAAAFALLGALLVWASPRWKPRDLTLLALGCVLLLLASGYVAFRSGRLLLDGATPALCLAALFAAMLLLTLAETTRQRRTLEAALHRQREESARIAGELDAARQVQMAMLPRAERLADPRVDLASAMLPAREVGGDLYDFFRIDERRLFFLVGDVAGKGLSASIFMAVSKALCKSATLRTSVSDVGVLMRVANAEVSRDNPDRLFVTAFAGILDLETGELRYCNAGHENPLRMPPSAPYIVPIVNGDGPPLCAVDGFPYRGAETRLQPGELLCVVTDGVAEARDASGALYGRERLQRALAGMGPGEPAAHSVVDALLADVTSFAAGAEQTDDITVLALRWRGPAAVRPR